MTLYLIGLGLENEKDITLKGLHAIRSCTKIYLENYTSLLQCSIADLEDLYGKKIMPASRTLTESRFDNILQEAKSANISLLVIGDPLSATTHIELIKRARELSVEIQIIHNASILTAVAETGLQLYKFGSTTSIPFLEDIPHLQAPYHRIRENHLLGYHTLCLLDIKSEKSLYMTLSQALDILQDIEKRLLQNLITPTTPVIGCARLGTSTQLIRFGPLAQIKLIDFGPPPHSLIIPGQLHFAEREYLTFFSHPNPQPRRRNHPSSTYLHPPPKDTY